MAKQNILIVLTSVQQNEATKLPTGAWLEELAAAYNAFIDDGGCGLILASPKGGPAPIDPLSKEDAWMTANGRRFTEDVSAQRLLAKTLPLAEIEIDEFDAVYMVGGVAAAWDFPDDLHLAKIVTSLQANGRVIAAVCHGVLGLSGAKSKDGRPLVQGRAVTGISNVEEVQFGADKYVPVMPQNRLTELGGRYTCAPPWAEHVVRDQNLLTGQNPASVPLLAGEMLKALSERI